MNMPIHNYQSIFVFCSYARIDVYIRQKQTGIENQGEKRPPAVMRERIEIGQ